MLTRPFVTTMALLLVLAYLGALTVSTAHLSQLYALFGGGLPYGVSIGLAVALETVAFLFSIISTSLGREAGPWAAPASTSALTLVWAGNGYAMLLAAPTQPWYVTAIASCFVPVCTLMVGKVLGSLFGLLDRLARRERDELPQQLRAAAAAVAITVTAPAAAIARQPDIQVRDLSPLHGQRVHTAAVDGLAVQELDQGINPGLDFISLPEPIRREFQLTVDGDSLPVSVEAVDQVLEAMTILSPPPSTAPPTLPAVPPKPVTDLLESQLQTLGLLSEDLEFMVAVWTERRGNQQQGGVRPKVSISIRDEVALALLGTRNVRYNTLAQQLGIGERRARAVATEVQALMKARGCWVEATA